jgi:hypothetical protein
MIWEWQLRNIQANASNRENKRTFGIQQYDIVDGPNAKEKNIGRQQQMSYCGLVVFIYKASKNHCDHFVELCTKQIVSIVQEKQSPFILCFQHTNAINAEWNVFLLRCLQTHLEETHMIIRTDPLLGRLCCSATLSYLYITSHS